VQLRTLARHLVPDFRGLPRPFWVLFAGTLVNRVGGFVLVSWRSISPKCEA
jgi:hypothetical protein